MKLRNKKTGKVYNVINECIKLSVGNRSAQHSGYYTSLAEINEEWEDYEEPNEYYCIDWTEPDGIYKTKREDIRDDFNKEIGNYFDTREEAELAVEKLKAWKLLKDECDIKFDGIIRDDEARLKAVKLSYDRHTVTFTRMRECMDALHLLFGGEE